MTPTLTPAAGISSDAAAYMHSVGAHSSTVAVSAKELPDLDSISDDELLERAQEQFRRAASADQTWRERAVQELNFCDALEHWDEQAKQERNGRPQLVFDLIGPKIAQVVNDMRQAPPEIRFAPVGSGGDKEEAKILQGLDRNIDNDSNANTARETAYEFSVKIGRGWWREDFEWENNDPEPSPTSFQQKLTTRRIANPFSVYPDPASDEFDYSDMMYCFVTEDLDKDTFEEVHGEDSAITALSGNFEGVGNPIRQEWFPNGCIRVAEYFWVEIDRSNLYCLRDGRVLKFEDLEDGADIVMKRVVEKRTVNWAKITGKDVIERKKWPGKWIPIVACVGREILKDGKRLQTGMIRPVIDANKSYDYMRSKEVEAIGLSPLSQWLVAEGSIENHEWKYADSNRKAFAYLEYKTRDAEGNPCDKPQRINSGVDTAGITQAIAHAAQDVMTGTNVYAPDTGQPVPDQSGVAIQKRVQQSDNAHYNYADNYARAMKHAGRIRLNLIPYVYSEDRIISIFDPDGKVRAMRVNGPVRPEDNIQMAVDKIIDLRKAPQRYDVVIGTGPGYATKRQQGFQELIQMAQIDPTIMQKAGYIFVKASDSPYAEEVAAAIAPPGVMDQDGPPVPLQAQQQLAQQSALIKALTQSVQGLTETINQKQLELASKERVADADRASRVAIAAMGDRATVEAAALHFGETAASNRLDAEMQAIESLKDHIETTADQELTVRLAREQREHEQMMAQQAQQNQPNPASTAVAPTSGTAPQSAPAS